MEILKILVSLFDIAIISLALMLHRNERNKATRYGYVAIAIIFLANELLIWM